MEGSICWNESLTYIYVEGATSGQYDFLKITGYGEIDLVILNPCQSQTMLSIICFSLSSLYLKNFHSVSTEPLLFREYFSSCNLSSFDLLLPDINTVALFWALFKLMLFTFTVNFICVSLTKLQYV